LLESWRAVTAAAYRPACYTKRGRD
jgi:hypothetical protein